MKKFDALLQRVETLKDEPLTPAVVVELRKVLTNRSGYLVSKAAAAVAHHQLAGLVPDMLRAFDRFLVEGSKTDPQCWGKNGIVKALAALGHDEPEVYERGLRYRQLEAVWGGSEDTAGALRANCALALVNCRSIGDIALLQNLVYTLMDADKTVRLEGARAIARVERSEAALLLRLKALTGDAEAEVTGACLTGVLAIEGAAALDMAIPFLDSSDSDVVSEAALALGLSRLKEAIPPLVERYQREPDKVLRSVLLTALAVSHQPDAEGAVLRVIAQGSGSEARSALDSLFAACLPMQDVLRSRILERAQENPDPSIAEHARRRSGL